MLGSLIMVVGALLQGFAQHVGMYIVARMLLGVGILFCIINGAALIGELGYPKERAVLTSLFNSSYFIGQILAAAIALGTTDIPSDWAWRLPSLLQICPSLLQISTVFLLPESPRYLISHDRDDDAAAVLTKYHAEGNADSLLVKAEIVQIRETIHAEMEVSKRSWLDLVKTAGMRRRFLVTIFIGLFTQLSGNTLLSYYSGILFDMMGYTSNYAKTRINLANGCWGLLNATLIALYVTRFKRRHMYMLSASLMLCAFIGITVSLEKLQEAKDGNYKNYPAGIAALFFYFAYSPTYNIGNNALTYSESFPVPDMHARAPVNASSSLPRRALALCAAKPRHRRAADLRQAGGLLLDQCQQHCSERARLALPRHLLRLDLLRVLHRLPALPGNVWPHARGARLLVRGPVPAREDGRRGREADPLWRQHRGLKVKYRRLACRPDQGKCLSFNAVVGKYSVE